MGIKILVIDDSVELCKLIDHYLGDKHELKLVHDGNSALELLKDNTFDLVLVDLSLPDMSGFEICSSLYSMPGTREAYVIVMSARSDIKAKVTAYNLGAINYLEKPLNSEILKAITDSVERHQSKNFDAKQIVGNIEINLVKQSVTLNEEEIHLTASELKILSYLSERPGKTIPREQLLAVISTTDKLVSERLVDTHISSLRKKIRGSTVIIESIYKEGYVLNVQA